MSITSVTKSKPKKIKDRQHDDADRDRIDAEAGVDDVGDVGAEDDEGGMRDVDDVEDAERNRYADCDRRIKSTEQDPGDQRVDQQIEAEIHLFPPKASLLPRRAHARGRGVVSVQER